MGLLNELEEGEGAHGGKDAEGDPREGKAEDEAREDDELEGGGRFAPADGAEDDGFPAAHKEHGGAVKAEEEVAGKHSGHFPRENAPFKEEDGEGKVDEKLVSCRVENGAEAANGTVAAGEIAVYAVGDHGKEDSK